MNAPLVLGTFEDTEARLPSGNRARFGGRWCFKGVGLSNIWRYGNLELPTKSGRLLLRGPNGTGKTTALEMVWPFLLDLKRSPTDLGAGKSRNSSLPSIMKEGAGDKRRIGYTWLILEGPGDLGIRSFGVRIIYSEGSSSQIKVEPFTIPGEPIKDMPLTEPGPQRGAITTSDAFRAVVEKAGGTVFKSDADYVTALANTVFGGDRSDLLALAKRIRNVRNPALLADMTPTEAREHLRAALPGVNEGVIAATGEALAESAETREAFRRDVDTATRLNDFSEVWSGHAVDVAVRTAQVAERAHNDYRKALDDAQRRVQEHEAAIAAVRDAEVSTTAAENDVTAIKAEIEAIKQSDAYAAISQLDDLLASAMAQRGEAAANEKALVKHVAGIRTGGAQLDSEVAKLVDEINGDARSVSGIDPEAESVSTYVSLVRGPYRVITLGDKNLDTGPKLDLVVANDDLTATENRWKLLAKKHETTASSATMLIGDYKRTVAPAADNASSLVHRSDAAGKESDVAAKNRDQANKLAAEATSEAAQKISQWADKNPELTQTEDSDPLESETVDSVAQNGAAALISAAEEWKSQANESATAIRTELTINAAAVKKDAGDKRSAAEEYRVQAGELRDGRDITPPRPKWAGPVGDAPFSGALQWKETANLELRTLLEHALATAGLLGATISEDGKWSDRWSVSAKSPRAQMNLTDYLKADPQHRLAAEATAVLERITVVASAAAASEEAGAVVGTDGSFRFGVISGSAPGSGDDVPEPSYIGAAQRREAALLEADRLDGIASDLEAEAHELDRQHAEFTAKADDIRSRASSFPDLHALNHAENKRVIASDTADARRMAADELAKELATARTKARTLEEEWRGRATDLGLPASYADIGDAEQKAKDNADKLRSAAKCLEIRISQLVSLQQRSDALSEDFAALPDLRAAAETSHDAASATEQRHAYLKEMHGTEASDSENRLVELTEKAKSATAKAASERQRFFDANRDESGKAEAVKGSQLAAQQRRPDATAALIHLQELMAVPGVSAAVGFTTTTPADEELIDQVIELTEGVPTRTRNALQNAHDSIRAHLRTWQVDRSEEYGDTDLLTYRCTYDGASYTPKQAAALSTELADGAGQQLSEADESVMRDFIIGRLPTAINVAFTELTDWVVAVNRKMKDTSASSGVGVQVEVELLNDLTPAQKTVHTLACKKTAATRTIEEDNQLVAALRSLLEESGDGTETDTVRVAKAVDIRDWVRLDYRIDRGDGEPPKRWTGRTGLSNGERRLVVLAPMLASIAALHDKFADTALRLAALDEIPIDVDEFGIDGLARYIAELDLDLICTSHQWDGAPGAWDGIDAHDLEVGPGRIVVAFPMLVRGKAAVPGDPDYEG